MSWEKDIQTAFEQLKKHKFKEGKELNLVEAMLSGVGESLDYMAIRESESNLQKTDIRLSTRTKGVDHHAFIKRLGNKIFYT